MPKFQFPPHSRVLRFCWRVRGQRLGNLAIPLEEHEAPLSGADILVVRQIRLFQNWYLDFLQNRLLRRFLEGSRPLYKM